MRLQQQQTLKRGRGRPRRARDLQASKNIFPIVPRKKLISSKTFDFAVRWVGRKVGTYAK